MNLTPLEVLARASLKEDLNEYEEAGCDAVSVKGKWKGRCPCKGCKLPGGHCKSKLVAKDGSGADPEEASG